MIQLFIRTRKSHIKFGSYNLYINVIVINSNIQIKSISSANMKNNMLPITSSSQSSQFAFRLTKDIPAGPVSSNSSIRIGSNNSNVSSVVTTNNIATKPLESDIKLLKNEFNTFIDKYNEDREVNEKHRKEMYTNYLSIMTSINNMKTEQEQLFTKLLNSSNCNNQTNNSNCNPSNYNHSQDMNDDMIEFESLEFDNALSIIETVFIPSILGAVSDEKSVLNKIL